MIPIFGALICKWKGHKRGRPIDTGGLLGVHPDRRFFECPRCGHVTSYKRKPNVVQLKAAG
jgi:hypothetical protein